MRLRRVLAHIESTPQLWNQSTWVSETSCGTAYCFAGWAVALEGIPIVVDDGSPYIDFRTLPEPWHSKLDKLSLAYLDGGWHRAAVSDVAALILGLHDKWALFRACLTLDELRESIDRICADNSAIRREAHVV